MSMHSWDKLSARAFKFKQYVISMLLFFGGHRVQAIQLTSNRQPKNSLITICLYKSKVQGAYLAEPEKLEVYSILYNAIIYGFCWNFESRFEMCEFISYSYPMIFIPRICMCNTKQDIIFTERKACNL